MPSNAMHFLEFATLTKCDFSEARKQFQLDILREVTDNSPVTAENKPSSP